MLLKKSTGGTNGVTIKPKSGTNSGYEDEDTQEYAMEHEEDQADGHDEEVFTTHEDAITFEDTMEEGNTTDEEDEDCYE